MIDFTKVASFFNKESIFCFTSDIDWSPEWAIKEMLTIFEEVEVPLTVFITHSSEEIEKQYRNNGRSQYVGLHPNFLPNSSHGGNFIEQIDFYQKLWPEARCFRSHAFFDNSLITDEFYARGFRYDSNLCLFLQPFCHPVHHVSGFVRFPVFWEDDAYYGKGLPFKIEVIQNFLDVPGLKIFNFHPLNLAINTPSKDYYIKHKFLYKTQDRESWHKYIFSGKGEKTFLGELFSLLRKTKKHCYYLDDLFKKLRTI